MCLAVPGKITSISGVDPLARTGKIDFGGILKDANLAYVPPTTPSVTETEPNEEFGSANLVAIGSAPVTGRCAGGNDKDWFRFAADRPGLVR